MYRERVHTRPGYVHQTGYVRRTYPNGVCTVLLAHIPERGMYRGAHTHLNRVCTPYIPERGMYSFARVHTRTGYVRRTFPNGVCTVLLAYIPDQGMYRGARKHPKRGVCTPYIPEWGVYSFALVRKHNVRKRGVSLDSKVQPRGSGFHHRPIDGTAGIPHLARLV